MTEYLTSIFDLFFNIENSLIVMFASAFLSSTLLPGNSEIVFSALATQSLPKGLQAGIWLWFFATLGNSLGSLTTYGLAYFVPQPQADKWQNKRAQWALRSSQKYGVWMLLLSWLPVVGDLLCGVAGWLRFNPWQSALFIALGKGLRYGVILWGIWAWMS